MTSPLEVSIRKQFPYPASEGFTLDVSFIFPVGVTVVFGPSGSGKTTLLDCIAGLTQPGAGKVVLDGNVLFDSDTKVNVPASRRYLGYVFQALALFPHLTVEQNIRYGLSRFSIRERDEMTQEIAQSFQIAPLAKQRPARISGGERQRLALARTLVTRPRALLLDEPLAALDDETKFQIIQELSAWSLEHPIPIIYVTHSLDEVFAIAEQVVVLKKGRIVKQGKADVVLAEDRDRLRSRLNTAGRC